MDVNWKDLIRDQNDEFLSQVKTISEDDQFLSSLLSELASGTDSSILELIKEFFNDESLNDIAIDVINDINECSLCHGSGGIEEYPCMRCHGKGVLN